MSSPPKTICLAIIYNPSERRRHQGAHDDVNKSEVGELCESVMLRVCSIRPQKVQYQHIWTLSSVLNNLSKLASTWAGSSMQPRVVAWTLRQEHNSSNTMIDNNRGNPPMRRGSMQVTTGVNRATAGNQSGTASDGGIFACCCRTSFASSGFNRGQSYLSGGSRSRNFLHTAAAVCATHAVPTTTRPLACSSCRTATCWCSQGFDGDAEQREYLGADSIADDGQGGMYPTEFLNSLNFSGMPPHKLVLRVGCPIILLRNLTGGLANGTRLIVKTVGGSCDWGWGGNRRGRWRWCYGLNGLYDDDDEAEVGSRSCKGRGCVHTSPCHHTLRHKHAVHFAKAVVPC